MSAHVLAPEFARWLIASDRALVTMLALRAADREAVAMELRGHLRGGPAAVVLHQRTLAAALERRLCGRWLADATHVVDFSGAYLQGQSSPTMVVLSGRGPAADLRVLRCDLGEPETPARTSEGRVFRAITEGAYHDVGATPWTTTAFVAREPAAVLAFLRGPRGEQRELFGDVEVGVGVIPDLRLTARCVVCELPHHDYDVEHEADRGQPCQRCQGDERDPCHGPPCEAPRG